MDDGVFGQRVRELRLLQRLSTRELARRAGISAGYVSQIEAGRDNVSIRVTRSLAAALGVPWLELFDGRPVQGMVLRREDRPRLFTSPAVRHYGITPTPLGNTVEVLISEYEPGEGAGDPTYTHGDSHEVCLVLRGTLKFTLGNDIFVLNAGDTVMFRTSTPHMLVNVSDETAEALWIVTPPSEAGWKDAAPGPGSGGHPDESAT